MSGRAIQEKLQLSGDRFAEIMRLQVHCYAGRRADERPLRFALDERDYFVEEILDQWYGPDHIFFKLRADDGNCYILRHQISVPEGSWELISFRQMV
jgi:hypothetical protein